MEKLIEQLTFLCGSLGGCILILTICYCCVKVFIVCSNHSDLLKQIESLKRKNTDLQARLETKTEMERARYEHERLINGK